MMSVVLVKVKARANGVAGGIAQGRQNPGLVSKAGGWVPSDSYFLSELRFLQPLSPRPLSCLGHVATVLSLPLEWLGLRRRVPVAEISGTHPHPCLQRLGLALSVSEPFCRNTQNFHPVLPRQQVAPDWSLLEDAGCQDRGLPGSHPFLREPGGLSDRKKSVCVWKGVLWKLWA